MDPLQQLLMGAGRDRQDNEIWLTRERHLPTLKKAAEQYRNGHVPEPGTIIRFRGDKIAMVFGPNEAENRFVAGKETGSPYYGMELDTIIAAPDGPNGIELLCQPGFLCIPLEELDSEQLDQAEELRKMVALFKEEHQFECGDVLEWKPGLNNRKQKGKMIFITDGVGGACPDLKGEEDDRHLLNGEIVDTIICCNVDEKPMAYVVDGRRLQPATKE